MSSGDPRIIRDGDKQKDAKRQRSYVAYAKGMDPNRDADWYDTAQDAAGGDDFCEAVPLDWVDTALRRKPHAKLFRIGVSSTQMKLVAPQ